MLRLLVGVSACFTAQLSLAQSAVPTLDQRIERVAEPIADAISRVIFYEFPVGETAVPFILVWLIGGALIATLYFRFINIRGFAHGFRLIRGDYAEPDGPGEVSQFQALTSAVSGTVGLGNIAGVAVAITIGGPGATFWMILAGLLGMSMKFAECTLGVMYRVEKPDGTISGGPMYYLSRGLAEQYPSLRRFGMLLAMVFAICCMGGAVGAGSMFQANQAYAQFLNLTGGDAGPLAGRGWLFGLALAVVAGLVVIGGITRIGSVTAKLVPAMALIYVLGALLVIGANLDQVPDAFAAIANGVFTAEGVQGGVLGALIVGFRRAAFSNESGLGSAAIAHAAVRTSEPITEGYVALWEPFIDTVVVCTMTALVIIITGQYLVPDAADGVQLTSDAFASVAPWFTYVLTLAILLFAFSTMITWAYYGAKAASFLFNESSVALYTFKVFYLSTAIVGCTLELGSLVEIADALLFSMAIPNLIGVYLLLPVVRKELKGYRERLVSGTLRRRHSLAPSG